MGGSSSKPALPDAPLFDESKATVSFGDVQDYEREVEATLEKANAAARQAWSSSTYLQYTIYAILFAVAGWAAYTYLWPLIMGYTSTPAYSTNLSITSAKVVDGDGKQVADVTSKIVDAAATGKVDILVDEKLSANMGQSLVVNYKYSDEAADQVTVGYNSRLTISPNPSQQGTSGGKQLWGGSSNLMSKAKDATKESTVVAKAAPLSDGKAGSYGYQFWMYIKDWDYKFGEEKEVLTRTDSTNSAIANPRITLHPTDNTMKVSVSIFPSGDSSKSEPAPAGHSGSTDDVFVCEVQDIPLNTWVAVTVTVSSRNLDIYLNGQLVKSCVLSGVPKPAAGDIYLNKNGGFSGYMCSFYHYAKLLQPADAMSFFSYGVPCSIPGTTAPSNYKVSYGLYDTKGKEVSKYVF